ncbi:rhodanese-like domain-containing protein 4, chloroplastic isoform X1 [Arachis duranensis]|uniref:Rhodanese-like domain-containing protein 4, chloroplastic isoform X1 n=1 Tax=Arachis duranensis TaxID=130453 RepID=A0A6P4DHI5_ARADU|nr:rhodanese-like domain-containing protein 4, chloroplastic isoform X1 [Arachis duranensis]
MEALNAVGLTPLSVLSDTRKQPRKFSSLAAISACKVSNFSTSNNTQPTLQQCLSKGLILAASVFNTGLAARALTYEEALQQSLNAPSSSGDFDINGVIDSVISFGTENPAVIAGGVAILAVPLVLSQVLKKPKPWGVESAKNAYAKLGADDNAQLLDIRAPSELRLEGTPDVGGLRKKQVSIPYNGADKPRFLQKLSLKFKDPENSTLFILDKFDGNAELVAELVTANGFKAAYAIKDGAEGPRGWKNSGLPWTPPKKGLSLDFGNLAEAIGESSDGLAVTLGIAAATGLGVLAFTEIETILQLLGSAAIIQFASRKLLYAEDRKRTLQQIDEFLNTKIAPKELGDEIKQIGKALLPTSTNNKVLPAPTEQTSEPTTADTTVQKAEATPDTISESKVDAVAAPSPEINSAEVKAQSIPGTPTPLSPYTSYPDLKPPTSPTPSQPNLQKAEATPPDTISESKVEAVATPAPEINSAEVKAQAPPATPRPLSPYPSYPDFKPPTSPSPSQP